ncbi:MAG: hypothetical protein J7555_10715 [Chloroflexi bacterium]|jgi:hypothetical protein|nr:hypothetical protein [Chloroflexota bacterium]
MGIYHLRGLGRSAGTVIGPLSYLAHRYNRWNEDDQRFFARSDEVRQRRSSSAGRRHIPAGCKVRYAVAQQEGRTVVVKVQRA